jgi:hypothetical protein
LSLAFAQKSGLTTAAAINVETALSLIIGFLAAPSVLDAALVPPWIRPKLLEIPQNELAGGTGKDSFLRISIARLQRSIPGKHRQAEARLLNLGRINANSFEFDHENCINRQIHAKTALAAL